jgi:hypothetical protein
VNMKKIVTNILDEHELYYHIRDWYNLGCLVVTEKKTQND